MSVGVPAVVGVCVNVGREEIAVSVVMESSVRLGTESALGVEMEFRVKVGIDEIPTSMEVGVAAEVGFSLVGVAVVTELIPPKVGAGAGAPEFARSEVGMLPTKLVLEPDEAGIEVGCDTTAAEIENPIAVVTSVVVGIAKSTLLVGVTTVDGTFEVVRSAPELEDGVPILGNELVVVMTEAVTDDEAMVGNVEIVAVKDVAASDGELVGSPCVVSTTDVSEAVVAVGISIETIVSELCTSATPVLLERRIADVMVGSRLLNGALPIALAFGFKL